LSIALRLSVGTGYAVWTGIGAAGAAIAWLDILVGPLRAGFACTDLSAARCAETGGT